MRTPQGYATLIGDRGLSEWDTITCAHCQRIVAVKPGTAATVYLLTTLDGRTIEEMGACCRVCMGAVCLKCHAVGTCTPWERKLEQMEARDRLTRSVLG